MEKGINNYANKNSDWLLDTKERIIRILKDKDFCKNGLSLRDRQLLEQLLGTESEQELPMLKEHIDRLLKQIEKSKDRKNNHEITCEDEMGLC